MKTTLAPILAFFAAVAMTAPAHAADIVPNAKAGSEKIAMCIGCHGIPDYHSSFPQVYHVPKLAGQSATYIVSALNEYKKGGRKFQTMQGIAAPLTDQDIADIAAYYSQQVPAKAPATVPPAPPAVQALLDKANCASCHGANFSKPIDGSMPKLAGQHADYLYQALKSYEAPDTAIVGRNNAVMGGVIKAQHFSDKELHMLTEYIGSLPGDVDTVPQSRFR